jgi:hypothetical protein
MHTECADSWHAPVAAAAAHSAYPPVFNSVHDVGTGVTHGHTYAGCLTAASAAAADFYPATPL